MAAAEGRHDPHHLGCHPWSPEAGASPHVGSSSMQAVGGYGARHRHHLPPCSCCRPRRPWTRPRVRRRRRHHHRHRHHRRCRPFPLRPAGHHCLARRHCRAWARARARARPPPRRPSSSTLRRASWKEAAATASLRTRLEARAAAQAVPRAQRPVAAVAADPPAGSIRWVCSWGCCCHSWRPSHRCRP